MDTVTLRIGRIACQFRRTTWDERDGATILAGYVFAGSRPDLVHLRDGLAAVAGSLDEPVVPIVCPNGPAGLYRVEGVEVALAGPTFATVSVTARPVLGHRAPIIETLVSGALLANANAITTGTAYPWHAVPANATTHSWWPADSAGVVAGQRPCEGGVVRYRRITSRYSGVATWVCGPADWYVGAALVTEAPTAQHFPVVGRRSLTTPWWAGNGLVRFTIDPATSALLVQWWRPAVGAWSTQQTWRVGPTADPYLWSSVTVVRNAPEAVRLLVVGARASTGISTRMWLTVRRGGRQIEGRIDTDASPSFGLTWPAGDAVTDATSYAHRAAAAADGTNWVVVAPDNFTVGASSVSPASSTALSWTFVLAASVTSGGADTSVAAASRAAYAVQTEQTTVGVSA